MDPALILQASLRGETRRGESPAADLMDHRRLYMALHGERDWQGLSKACLADLDGALSELGSVASDRADALARRRLTLDLIKAVGETTCARAGAGTTSSETKPARLR